MPPPPPPPSPTPLVVVGRPFRRELNGDDIAAEAVVMATEDDRLWSQQHNAISIDNNLRTSSSSSYPAATEWSTRAVGEHASIASFAAFTIALMTNQAPPLLIRDALQAALDELNHAQVSFEMASFLSGGQVIEPSALPNSKLSFTQNLTALALGAAQEGCVDESLSALELAADTKKTVMLQADNNNNNKNDELTKAAAETTWKIAMDESRHAMLAWRTIEWVCAVDTKVCEHVQKDVLNPHYMQAAFEKRFSNREDIQDAWTKIVNALPMAVSSGVGGECPSEEPVSLQGGADALASYIIGGVLCTHATK